MLKSNLSCLLTAIAFVLAASNPLMAQDQNGAGGGLVTVLDVAKVFDSNPAFELKMDRIKGEADQLKTQIEAEQAKIREDAMKLQDLAVGSPDRNQKEGELEKRQTELRTRARQSEQELLNREAIIYYETYRAMQEVVGIFADENGIAIVLRYDSTEIDPTNRPEVIKGVNRTVVYHRQLDLTTSIISRLNERTAASGANTMQR